VYVVVSGVAHRSQCHGDEQVRFDGLQAKHSEESEHVVHSNIHTHTHTHTHIHTHNGFMSEFPSRTHVHT
jgi:hypothetical protein